MCVSVWEYLPAILSVAFGRWLRAPVECRDRITHEESRYEIFANPDRAYVQRAQPHGAAEGRAEHLEWRGYDGELRADAERPVPGDADACFAALWQAGFLRALEFRCKRKQRRVDRLVAAWILLSCIISDSCYLMLGAARYHRS